MAVRGQTGCYPIRGGAVKDCSLGKAREGSVAGGDGGGQQSAGNQIGGGGRQAVHYWELH